MIGDIRQLLHVAPFEPFTDYTQSGAATAMATMLLWAGTAAAVDDEERRHCECNITTFEKK